MRLLCGLLLVAMMGAGCESASRRATGGGGEGEGEGEGAAEGEGEGPGEGEGEGATADVAAVDAGADARDAEPPEDGGLDVQVPPEDTRPEPRDTGIPAICRAPRQAPQQPPVDLAPHCRGAGQPMRIHDLRNPACPDHDPVPAVGEGRDVEIAEAVVTGVFGHDFSVSDPGGGPWSGIFVYSTRRADPEGVEVGARVRLTGRWIEFYTLSELTVEPDGVEVLGAGVVPEPLLVADPRRLADDGDLGEALESVLLRVDGVKIDTTVPDCPSDHGMFVVSGGLRVDDEAEYDYLPTRGDVLTRLVGVGHYSFDHRKLLPRGDQDMDVIACGGFPDKCEAAECPVVEDAAETGLLIVSELQDNPLGLDATREYVELYNPGPGALNVEGWKLQACSGQGVALHGQVPARGYLVLASSLDPEANGGVEATIALGELFLPNGFGSLLIFDAQERLVDQVRYAPTPPWPSRHAGRALELVEPAADNRDGASWGWGLVRYGEGGWGTPGGPYVPE